MRDFDRNAIKREYLKSLSCDDEYIINLIDVPGIKINNSYILFYMKDIKYWIKIFLNMATCVPYSELKRKYNTTISTKIFKIKQFIAGFVFETSYKKNTSYNISKKNNNIHYFIQNKKEVQFLENGLKKIANFDKIEKKYTFSAFMTESHEYILKSSCEQSKIKKCHENDIKEETNFDNISSLGSGKFVVYPKLCFINSPEEEIVTDPQNPLFFKQLYEPLNKFSTYDGFEYYGNTGTICFISYNTIHAEIKHTRKISWDDFFDED